MNLKWILFLWSAAFLASCSPKVEPPPRSVAPSPGPTFSLKDLQGQPVTSDSLKNKIVVLHFCASWSPSSAREVRQLALLQEKYRKKGVQVVGIALEEGDGADMRAFAARTPFNYPVALAPSDFHREFGGIEAIPTTFMISTGWVIMNKHTGLISPEFLAAELDLMIREAKESGNKPTLP